MFLDFWKNIEKCRRSSNFRKKNSKKKFGVPGIPQNRKIGVKFWKMIFIENTLMIILRPFGGKSDVKWRCDTTYKSVYAKSEIRLVPPLNDGTIITSQLIAITIIVVLDKHDHNDYLFRGVPPPKMLSITLFFLHVSFCRFFTLKMWISINLSSSSPTYQQLTNQKSWWFIKKCGM